MSEIVDVEIKTFELLFFMLKGDIIKLEVAKKKEKTVGGSIFHREDYYCFREN